MNFNSIPKIILKEGREKSILRKHPWIFSGAIRWAEKDLGIGDTVAVLSSDQDLLGYGAYSPFSQIRCRMWKFSHNDDPQFSEEILKQILRQRLLNCLHTRQRDINLIESDAYRLVHAESDRLPGLIVDVYRDVVAIQFLSCGVEKYRDDIVNSIQEFLSPNMIYERSDAEVRRLEGLSDREGVLIGNHNPSRIMITENKTKFYVDIAKGQKTGFYLDQRENRSKIRAYSRGKDVLDCFSYTGSFSINALAGGANKATVVDSSDESLKGLIQNTALNGISDEKIEIIHADVFNQLRSFRDQRREFDLVILDPPKFAPTRKQAHQAARGYKDINLLSLKLLKPGGILFTFSCSGGVDQSLFQKIVAGAAVDAGVDLQFIGGMTQASDHPILSSFPEGEYLKGLICRKL